MNPITKHRSVDIGQLLWTMLYVLLAALVLTWPLALLEPKDMSNAIGSSISILILGTFLFRQRWYVHRG